MTKQGQNRYNLMLTNLRAIRNHLDNTHDELNRNVNSFASEKIVVMRKLIAEMEEQLQWLEHHMSK